MSDPGQHTDNQLSDLFAWADRGALEVVVTTCSKNPLGRAPIRNNRLKYTERPLPLSGAQAEVREFCKLLARILRRRGSEDMAPHEPNAVNTNSRNPNF